MFKIPVSFVVLFLFTLIAGCKDNPADSEKVELNSNNALDIIVDGSIVWFGTGYGLANSGNQVDDWNTFTDADGLPRGGISALHIQGNEIWVAGGYDSSDYAIGSGLSYSADYGASWRFIPQPGNTLIQNITYDLTVLNGVVWIVSFGGGLRKSDDLGLTWQIVSPDTFDFSPGNHLNHRSFSVTSIGNELWVGTAGGINRTTDGGATWQNFSHQNQAEPISGNFVVALRGHSNTGSSTLWAATRRAEDQEEFNGLSLTTDSGATWATFLDGVLAHNFAVTDSVVYVAANEGLYITRDDGLNWQIISEISDVANDLQFPESDVYGVGYLGAQSAAGFGLWVGGPNGLAHSTDNGMTWEITPVKIMFENVLSKSLIPAGLSSVLPETYKF